MSANQHRYRLFALMMVLNLAFVCRATAQSAVESPDPTQSAAAQPETPIKLLTNYVETDGSYLTFSNGYGYWVGGCTRAAYNHGKDVWNGEANGQHEFGDSGVYFAAGDTHTFNSDWYGSLTIGSSAGGFFWPRYRMDAFLNRKWMRRRQLITTAGFGYSAAKDVHRDHSFFLGTSYYFQRPWILEGGLYFNVSNPGTVLAPSGFVAVTQGRNKHQYVVVRGGYGEEAYQLIGPTVSLARFRSQTLTITWRKWVGKNWGINLVGDSYHNPYYIRGGTSFGLFKDF
jgi:YaiO family outer membrane protein